MATASNACGSASDDIDAIIVPPFQVDLGPDTTYCTFGQVVLSSGYPDTMSVWEDGTQATQHVISTSGTFAVTVSTSGCTAGDTVVVSLVVPPTVALGPDTVLCGPDEVLLHATINTTGTVLWSDGSTAIDLPTSVPGTYWVQFENACGSASDSITVQLAPEHPASTSVTTCPFRTEDITPGFPVSVITWSTGDTTAMILAGEGSYTYAAMDLYGCPTTGTVDVVVDPAADGSSFVPNVFTPNSDGINDAFGVVGAESDHFELTVYDRWGLMTFATTDIQEHWSGDYRSSGKPVPDGVYVYVLHFRDRCSGDVHQDIGHVTLLR